MKLPEAIRDLSILAGAVAVVIGLALAWAPLAWITGGALLLAFGIVWELDQRRASYERTSQTGFTVPANYYDSRPQGQPAAAAGSRPQPDKEIFRMSVLDLLLPDRRGIMPQEFRPTIRHIPADMPPAVPPRPAAAPVVPQTLEQAEAALHVLQAASKIVRDKMAQNPDLPRGEECFSDTEAKAIRDRRAEDVQTASTRGSRRRAPFHFAVRRPLAHALRPDLPTPTARSPAPLRSRAESLPTSTSGRPRPLRRGSLPDLRKADVEGCQGLLGLRDPWQAPLPWPTKSRRDGGPVAASRRPRIAATWPTRLLASSGSCGASSPRRIALTHRTAAASPWPRPSFPPPPKRKRDL